MIDLLATLRTVRVSTDDVGITVTWRKVRKPDPDAMLTLVPNDEGLDDYLAERASAYDSLLSLGGMAPEQLSAVHRDPRPCKGQNTNVCVAEGCYGEPCLEPRYAADLSRPPYEPVNRHAWRFFPRHVLRGCEDFTANLQLSCGCEREKCLWCGLRTIDVRCEEHGNYAARAGFRAA